MRYLRLVIGGLIVVAALWVIIGEQMSGASANAVVNAEVVTLRAPVAGDLTVEDRVLGARVEQGEVLARVEDRLVDNVRLSDLQMEQSFAETELTHATERLEAAKQARDRLAERSASYQDRRVEELATRLEFARERVERLEAGNVTVEADTETGGSPAEDGSDTQSADEGGLTLTSARERVAVLEIELAAARAGVYLGDGYNDAPVSEQLSMQLETDIAALEADLVRAQERLDAVSKPRRSIARACHTGRRGQLSSPVSGLFWEVLQADGVNVQRGDPLLRILDCESLIVTLSVTERIYNDLTLGQSAEFRMSGQSDIYDATVTRLAGSGAERIYGNLAVAPSQQHLERFDVTLRVPALNQDSELGCVVGRTGRAFFERRPLDWVRSVFG